MSIAQFPIPAATGQQKTGFTSQQLNQTTTISLDGGVYQVETTSELQLSGPTESFTIPGGSTQEIVTADGLTSIAFAVSAYPSEFIVQKQTQVRGKSPNSIASDGVSKIVAATNGGDGIYSGDGGATWQIIDGIFSNNNHDSYVVAYGGDGQGGDRFVMGGEDNHGAYSDDGLTWTYFGNFSNSTNSDTYQLLWSEDLGRWVQHANRYPAWSNDGANWNNGNQGNNSSNYIYNVESLSVGDYNGATQFVAGGNSGRVMSSDDGIAWTYRGENRLSSNSNGSIRNMAYIGDETWVASDSNSFIGISYNGGYSYSSFDADTGTPARQNLAVVGGVPYLASGNRIRANKTMVRNEQAWDLFGPPSTNITTSLYPEDLPQTIRCISSFQGRLLYGINGGFMWSDQFATNRAVLTKLSDLAFKVDG